MYDQELRENIDKLEINGIVTTDNSLFTKGEQDYFNYVMNKSKFSNSLDLRNKYIHGTHTNDTQEHKSNYLLFLKIIVILILKINSDLDMKEYLCTY